MLVFRHLCNARTSSLECTQFRYVYFRIAVLTITACFCQGISFFEAKVNIEVSMACERTVEAIERNGGTILTRFVF